MPRNNSGISSTFYMKGVKNYTGIWIVGFILIISVLFTAVIGINRYGDAPSYYLMVDSLIRDGDLILDNKDMARWQYGKFEHFYAGAYVLIDEEGIMRYGKPILYPLIALPFFLFFGKTGIILLNGLFLGGSIAFCYLFLKRYLNTSSSLLIAVMFFLCSFMPVYAAWMHPEMMLFFACSLCMWLWLCKDRPVAAALVIGIISSAKITFLLLLIPLIVVLVSKKRFRQLGKVMGVSVLGIGFVLLLTYLFLGQFSPYSGARGYGYLSFRQTPYLTLKEVKDALVISSSQFEGFEFNAWGLFFRNLLNFFIGRFTGITWYAFPGIVCAGVYLLYRRNIKKEEKILGDSILATTLLLALVLIIARPLNYFGGRGFICNRYFFILPALLFLPAIRLVRNPKKIALLFLPGLFISSQIIRNEILSEAWSRRYWKRTYVFSLGAQTCTFPLKYAPLEITPIESFLVYSVKIPNNIFLYAPSGLKKQTNRGIILDAGQELVLVQENGVGYLKLETDSGQVILQPKVILKDKLGGQNKSFYYFKAKRQLQIETIKS